MERRLASSALRSVGALLLALLVSGCGGTEDSNASETAKLEKRPSAASTTLQESASEDADERTCDADKMTESVYDDCPNGGEPSEEPDPLNPGELDLGYTYNEDTQIGIDPLLASSAPGVCVAAQYTSTDDQAWAFPVSCADPRATWMVSGFGTCPSGSYEDVVAGGTLVCLHLNFEQGECWSISATPPNKVACDGNESAQAVYVGSFNDQCPGSAEDFSMLSFAYEREDLLVCLQ